MFKITRPLVEKAFVIAVDFTTFSLVFNTIGRLLPPPARFTAFALQLVIKVMAASLVSSLAAEGAEYALQRIRLVDNKLEFKFSVTAK